MHPIRIVRTTGFRLAVLFGGLFSLSVLVLFAVIYWTTSRALHQQLETAIEQEAHALAEHHLAGDVADLTRSIEERLKSQPQAFYLLLDPEERKVTGNLPKTLARPGWQDHPMPEALRTALSDDPADADGHRLLLLGTSLPDGFLLVVGKDLYAVSEVEEAIIRVFGWVFGITVLVAAAGGYFVSTQFLRRIDSINRTTRSIMDGRLSDRVPTHGTGDELDRLASNLNGMLDRLQALMESLRQVSSDIAHDLRTPLSRLRQRLEETRIRARQVEDFETAIDGALADTESILDTFSALLRIAQIEAGTRRAAFAEVHLSNLFQSILEAYEAVAEDQGKTLAASIEPGVRVHGDRELLTQMMANLVENAINHTPPGTNIRLALTQAPSGPVASVADDGPGIPAADRERVFQRFVRLETSRSTTGSGLGLSLVAAVATIHGITVELSDNQPGLRAVLDFGIPARGVRHSGVEAPAIR